MTSSPMSAAGELELLQSAAVLVIGDVLLDRYIGGDVARISPEAPVPVVLEKEARAVLGGAANVAANVASLGARAVLVGRTGLDDDGTEVKRLLDLAGVEDRIIVSADCPTTTKLRVLAGAQQIVRIDRETVHPTDPSDDQRIRAIVDGFARGAGPRAVVVADYAKGFLTDEVVRLVIDTARAAGIPVVTDPKSRDLARYAGSTILKPNLTEALDAADTATPPPGNEREIVELAEKIRAASGVDNVVLSCSADGVFVTGRNTARPLHLRSHAREVADVSGAGDTLVALTALGLAAQLTLARAVEIANLAAGAVCEKVGTATLSPTELLRLTTSGPDLGGARSSTKILRGRAEAARIGAQYEADERRLVFANGCFDLLHAGHVHLLQQARSQGDALMVALNSDVSIQRLKGPGRPLQPAEDRCEIMAALSCVDYVVVFDEDTPLDLIRAARPAILVKGDDYTIESVVGAADVESWGGTVAIVPRLSGRSTSNLVSRKDCHK